MKRKEYNKYFEILELSSDALLSEVESAYLKLKEACVSEKSSDMSKKEKKRLEQLDEAYQKLSALLFEEEEDVVLKHEKKSDDTGKAINRISSDISFFNGLALKQIRKRLNVDLQDISYATKIQIKALEDIENENYEALPPAVYIKGFVKSYAKHLSLDDKQVAEDYIKGYDEWKKAYEKRMKSKRSLY